MKGSAITGPVAKECVCVFTLHLRVGSHNRLSTGGFVAPYRGERWYCGLVYSLLRIVLFFSAMHLFRTSPHHPLDAAFLNACPRHNCSASKNEVFFYHEMAQ